jgi:hypothetical protein
MMSKESALGSGIGDRDFRDGSSDDVEPRHFAVTKKGQDLTRPGEKDDLKEIFHKQREEYKAKREQANNEAKEKDARARNAGDSPK